MVVAKAMTKMKFTRPYDHVKGIKITLNRVKEGGGSWERGQYSMTGALLV